MDKINISSEKAYEVEVKIVTDGIARRMDYNRRIQNLQVVIIGACFAGYFNLSGKTPIQPETIEYACLAVSLINIPLTVEIRQNTFYQRMAAIYIRDIINKKFHVEDKKENRSHNEPLGWEAFLRASRTENKINRYSFTASAHLVMSIFISAAAIAIYADILLFEKHNELHLFVSLAILTSSLINTSIIYDYIRGGMTLDTSSKTLPLSAVKGEITFSPPKTNDFEYFYSLRHTTMLEHFNAVGKDWDESELFLHKKIFNLETLWMIEDKGIRVGFVNLEAKDGSDQKEINLSLFCIEPQYQKKGIGQKVMNLIIASAAARGASLKLNVLKLNPAFRLYERLGFRKEKGENDLLVYYYLNPALQSQAWSIRMPRDLTPARKLLSNCVIFFISLYSDISRRIKSRNN